MEAIKLGGLDGEEVTGEHLGGVLADELPHGRLAVTGAGELPWLRRILATPCCSRKEVAGRLLKLAVQIDRQH